MNLSPIWSLTSFILLNQPHPIPHHRYGCYISLVKLYQIDQLILDCPGLIMRDFPLVTITLTGLMCVSGKTIEEKSSEGNVSDRVFAIFPAVAYIFRSVMWEVLLSEVFTSTVV